MLRSILSIEKSNKLSNSSSKYSNDKSRADLALVKRKLADNRTKAAALIMSGKVFSNQKRIEKAGEFIDSSQPLDVRGPPHPWVGRGGIKLAYGLKHFGLSPNTEICIDIGASTGGFTDVLLYHGARKVYSVDVGYGQLAQKLRDDSRVIVMERTNARNLKKNLIPETVGAIVCDVSFISLKTILPLPLRFAHDSCWLIALIKPQFELGPKNVGKGGVVRKASDRTLACDNIKNWLSSLPGWQVFGLVESPIRGASGNSEYLIGAKYNNY